MFTDLRALPAAFLVLTAAVAIIATRSPGQEGINPMGISLLGQSEWLAGSQASLRVIVKDFRADKPLPARVTIGLRPEEGKETRLFHGDTNRFGTLDAKFDVPDREPGKYTLAVEAVSRLGTDRVERPITISRAAQILLTTDKPLYQPGQIIHMRALALHQPSRQPVAGETLTFEVEDAKANKVFKHTEETSRFGIAATTFQLADEVNFGRYTVRASLAALGPAAVSERKVDVERYVLPKFKVTVTADKTYYLPGKRATGKVQCDYFFGKAVDGAEVVLKASTFDVGRTEIAEIKGTTDGAGTFRWEVNLPKHFVGQPLEQGRGVVTLVAEVTDKAEHTERASTSFPVAAQPIDITVVPEGGALKPGLPNIVYVLTSYPDGKPAQTTITPRLGKRDGERFRPTRTLRNVRTDRLGIAVVRFMPKPDESLRIAARDRDGRLASAVKTLEIGPAADALILRTDKALAAVGDDLRLSVLSTRPRGSVYLDVIKDRQTVLTKAMELQGGHAYARISLAGDLAGTLEIHAYQIMPNEDIIRDTRLVYVDPADDLSIKMVADKETYRPGQEGKVHFTVRDKRGRPTAAALGIAVVDESVFALQEMHPGLEKLYFTLEEELMKPRYEIHGFDMPAVVKRELPVPRVENEARQAAARVLLAAAPARSAFTLRANTYTERLEPLKRKWLERVGKDAQRINQALQKYRQQEGRSPSKEAGLNGLVDARLLTARDLRDQWGRGYRYNADGDEIRWIRRLLSAGPNGKWDTIDDLVFDARRMRGWALGGGGLGDAVLFGGVMREEAAGAPLDGMWAARVPKAAATTPTAAAIPQRQVRIRQFFPETMLWEPALITDDRGRATLDLTMADSITSWRMSATASGLRGQTGSLTSALRVFQDFFVDLDLPVALTQNDEVSVPVAVYNYLTENQTVRLRITREEWFELLDEEEKTLELHSQDIRVAYFRIRARKIGVHRLTVRADGTKLSDAIRRQVEVAPDGKEQRDVINDRLEGTIRRTVRLPAEAVPDASTILVKIYPGTFSQAVEGLDSMLRMPFGCFEQTSSVTYPNVLVTDYMKSVNQINPELQMKAEGFINVGYQRLVSYEVEGGGFSWFGRAPAHQVLTAYGLMQFSDMSRVHEVDPRLIERTQRWLAGRQKKDGTWEPDKGGIAEGAINRQTDVLRVTAYIAWALADSGYQGSETRKAADYVIPKIDAVDDPYALAVVCNLLVNTDRSGAAAARAFDRLAKMATADDRTAYWQSKSPTFTEARDKSADLETTGLATYALVKEGRHAALANKALTYLVQSKDSFGTWHTTQATVWSLKAMLAALGKATEEINGEITVKINGKQAGSFAVTPDDYDVVRQIDLKQFVKEGDNQIEIDFAGKGSALYQIVSKYYLPWDRVPPPPKEALTIDVEYDKTDLATDDIATCRVRIENLTGMTAKMPVIDLGIPPGFAVESGDLAELVGSKVIEKFTLTPRQIIIYLDALPAGKPLELTYRMKAKFPIRAQAPRSRVYAYYNPEAEGIAPPQEIRVRE